MAGIYIHVPFCRKKCHYCDFYRTTSIGKKPLFLSALSVEIALRREYTRDEPVETIYWGGGTPSVLSSGETGAVIRQLRNSFRITEDAEITLEANPDDVSDDWLTQLRETGINRLSLGIQSLENSHLQLMNRRHSAETAIKAVEQAYKSGFRDISIDLIYGIPGQTTYEWEKTLHQALQLPVSHLSAYHLTYHEGTLFHRWLGQGRISELPEEESIRQFELLLSVTAEYGFEQYEISNFARDKAWSRHNTGYWSDRIYLGLGPSAHSYNSHSRSWNVSNLGNYITSVLSGKLPMTTEILSEKDRLNDYILTGIRTKWGISIPLIREKFGEKNAGRVLREVLKFEEQKLLNRKEGKVTLTPEGILVSDRITRDLIVE